MINLMFSKGDVACPVGDMKKWMDHVILFRGDRVREGKRGV